MNSTEKFLFEAMDRAEAAIKQARDFAKEVSDTIAPVAEEVTSAAAEHLERATVTVTDEIKKAADASEAAADKENCKEVLAALSQYAGKTSMTPDVINAMHKVSAYYNDEKPIFSGTEKDSELLVLIMTAMHSSMQKSTLSAYRKITEWVIRQYQKGMNYGTVLV